MNFVFAEVGEEERTSVKWDERMCFFIRRNRWVRFRWRRRLNSLNIKFARSPYVCVVCAFPFTLMFADRRHRSRSQFMPTCQWNMKYSSAQRSPFFTFTSLSFHSIPPSMTTLARRRISRIFFVFSFILWSPLFVWRTNRQQPRGGSNEKVLGTVDDVCTTICKPFVEFENN